MIAGVQHSADETLIEHGVREGAAAIRRGVMTSTELVEACLARIAATDDRLQAWVTVDAAGAREAASTADAAVRAGRSLGALHGVPVGIKDLIDVAGLPTSAGAPAFAHSTPDRDAPLVARLRAAGAVILGKTVPTAFAFKDPAPTLNPWSASHTPGGSSSGSAAAVAARQVPVAIGTQTVGSILRPAAFCGVVGLKGVHGEVPLEGVVPLAWSFDHAGPITRSVADGALVHSVLRDSPLEVATIARPTIGVSAALQDLAEPELRAHIDDLVRRLKAAGATIVETRLPPETVEVEAIGAPILQAEAAAYHRATYAAHARDYPPRIAELVRAGLSQSADEVAGARRRLDAFRASAVAALAGVDALFGPVAPGAAPRRELGTGDPALCAAWSYAGIPAISLPTGVDGAGLPLAVQLVGAPARFDRLLGAAAWVESVVVFDGRPDR